MYRGQHCFECEMPFSKPLTAVVLNGSLKHKPEPSNTEDLAARVVENMNKHAKVEAEIFRLADMNIPVGLGYRESKDDEWPTIVEKIKAADIVIFATPIWWSSRSSLMQRVIERLDGLDEEYLATGRSALYNKVAGIVITGHEDGALATMAHLMAALTWFNFTLPPECAAYWVGEVGEATRGSDAERRRANPATQNMAKNLARNLVYYAQLLKKYPMVPKK
jgi:multimeric flavodoxin WrbA